MKVCKIDGCNKKHYAKGYCSYHYERFRKYGDPEIVFPGPRIGCLVEGCGGEHFGLGYCRKHYERFKKYGDPLVVDHAHGGISRKENPICSIEGCEKPVQARGWCSMHYKRWELYGNPLADFTRTRAECSVKGCSRPAHAHGYCQVHYDRWRRDSEFEVHSKGSERAACRRMSVKRPDDLARILMAKVQIEPEFHCWIWQGGKRAHLWLQGKYRNIVRVSYATFVGVIPEGKLVCHICDRGDYCIAPNHLYLGTSQNNSDDALVSRYLQKECGLSKNEVTKVKLSFWDGLSTEEISEEVKVSKIFLERARRKVCWGYPDRIDKKQSRSIIKLSKKNILEIKALLNKGISGSEVARQFKVSRQMINQIKLEVAWKHIKI